jgi:hypothetical protein
MKDLSQRSKFIKWTIIFLLTGLFLFANLPILIITYSYLTAVMLIRTWLSSYNKRAKLGLSITMGMLAALQIVFSAVIVFNLREVNLLQYYLSKFFAVTLVLLPFAVERLVTVNKNTEFYPPSVEDIAAISFTEIRNSGDKIAELLQSTLKTAKSASPTNLKMALGDLHRHSATKYINNGTLTEAYFERANDSMEDPHLYIVISNTGSAASEIISVFTQKEYNHASLSFDYDLDTIISYNGGANVYPPGMNAEMLEQFHQKEGASVLVYRLPVTKEQKSMILNKIIEINREGSAYNMVGLVVKRSYKPNIMFCSQFVYKMLKLAGVQYFNKKDCEVRPTDLIELDYYKKLKFAYEINFDYKGPKLCKDKINS